MTSNPATRAVQQQFGAVAAAYATSAVHASGPDLAAMVAAAGEAKGRRVLDLGCGAGHAGMAFAAAGASVTAVDVTPEMVEVANELASQRGLREFSARVADVSALPFDDASFDVVVSRFSAHHYAEPTRAFSEAARVLSAGGRFLLVDTVPPEDASLDTFFNAFEFVRDASHVRNWRASEWLRMLAGAGFRDGAVLERFAITLDFADWVKRSQTPGERVEALRTLFRGATPAQRSAFDIRTDEPWALAVPTALIAAPRD